MERGGASGDDAGPMEQPKITVAQGRRRTRTMQSVARGLHRTRLADPDPAATPEEKAQHRRLATIADLLAWQQALRADAGFTHLSAVSVRGWALPELPATVPVWITQRKGLNPTCRRGARVIRQTAAPTLEAVEGVRLAAPAETLLACARDLSVLDLVVVIDSALHSADVTLAELEEVAASRRRGAVRLREALALADGRSESAWESLLRVLHVVCGFEVEPQREFHHQGRFVARADLHLVGTTSIHEYDGAEHRHRKRQESDLRRDRSIVAAGLIRRGYVKDDLASRPLEIVRDACSATGRTFDPRVVGPWLTLWNASSFSPYGAFLLAERLAVPTQ
jgi:very-short-patch-repair endonuclease